MNGVEDPHIWQTGLAVLYPHEASLLQFVPTVTQDFLTNLLDRIRLEISDQIQRRTTRSMLEHYVGTVLDRDGMDWLVEYVCSSADVQPAAPNIPMGVEILRRSHGKASFLFVLNNSDESVIVPVDGDGCDLLTSTDISGSLELGPAGAAVVQMK